LGISFESVVELVRGLRAGSDPHLLSAAAESAYGQRVALATGIPVTYFDDLDPWKSAIGAAAAIVTPDCGALHVAGMVGTPVVAVFPPEAQSAARAARWAPWAAPHRILRADDGWPSRAVAALAQSPLRGTL
jgi:ADP-heptose:LPS heptosyltransferase